MKSKKRLVVIPLILLFLGSTMNISAQSTSGGSRRGSATFQLTVTANITASVTIKSQNNKSIPQVNGTTTFVQAMVPGNYNVQISAPGYVSQTQIVILDANKAVHFDLLPVTARLTVTSNVNGAAVQVTGGIGKGGTVNGNAPFHKDLALANYSVAVSANGYISQTKTVNLTRNSNLHFNLQPAMGTVQVIIPPESLNKKDVNARGKIQILDNGTVMNGTTFQLRPGQHTIQIISGGLMTQTTFNVEAGITYTIRPVLTLIVE